MKHECFFWKKLAEARGPLLAIYFLLTALDAFAGSYTVNTTADGSSSSGTVNLRGAILAADAAGGSSTISVPAGTYTLTMGEISFGNSAQNITITGAGAGSTTISMTSGAGQDRIFNINFNLISNVTTTISGITFTNGHLKTDQYGGGAILGGGPSCALSVTSCAFTSNSVDANISGPIYGGGAICYGFGGTCTIDQCAFTSNSVPYPGTAALDARSGGAIYFYDQGSGAVYPSSDLHVTNCTFSSNSVTNGGRGGAIFIKVLANGTAASPVVTADISKNNFLSNSVGTAGSVGGAISSENDLASTTYTMNFNRFVGNTSGSGNGSALYMEDNVGNINANNNWWGCNGGPTVCADKAFRSAGNSQTGALTTTLYLQLKTSAASTSICTTTGTTITSGFTSNSASQAIAAASLSALVGVPISFSATLGSISGAQIMIQSTGVATATYTAGSSAGSGTVNAVVDNVPGNDATAKATITISTLGTWLGGSSSAWSNTANWGCGTLPTASTDVTISSGTTFSPQVDITTAACNNLIIGSGATLSFTGSGNILAINGSVTNSGTFTATGGKVVFSGSGQTIPALTYGDLQMTGGGNKTLSGNVTVNGVLTLTNGYVLPGSNNLTLGSAGSVSGASASSFVVTSGTGKLVEQNIGTAGRTGNILFPVGTSTSSYTPISINNTGTADNFSVNMLSSVYPTYDASNNPTSSALSSDVVGRTWLVSEAVAGGSNVSLTFQWNMAEELSGFDRTNCFGSHYYAGSAWHKGSISAASGGNPYMQTLTGVTSFSPFGVGSAGSPLPLKLLSFAGSAESNLNLLQWTASGAGTPVTFELERSDDASNFTRIASIAEKTGASSANSAYSYSDEEPLTLNYYRLKLLTADGNSSYSNTLMIRRSVNPVSIDISPNPFKDRIDIRIDGIQGAGTNCSLSLTDVEGRIVRQRSVQLPVGQSMLMMDELGNLPAGTYFLKVDTGERKNVKLIKLP